MRKKLRHITLAHNEFLVSPDVPDAKHFEIFFKGEKVKNVKGIIIMGGFKDCN